MPESSWTDFGLVEPCQPLTETGALRDATTNHVAPSWVKRAGPDARTVFNQYIAPHSGFTLP